MADDPAGALRLLDDGRVEQGEEVGVSELAVEEHLPPGRLELLPRLRDDLFERAGLLPPHLLLRGVCGEVDIPEPALRQQLLDLHAGGVGVGIEKRRVSGLGEMGGWIG